MLGARSLLSRAVLLCFYHVARSCVDPDPLHGAPCFPFIGEGKARVLAEKNEKNEREKKASRIVGSFFSFMRVPPIL